MRKLAEVQKAEELMHEAMGWSEFKWLFQKSTVRETADLAKAALDRLERAVKSRWTVEAKAAYKSLTAKVGKPARERQKRPATATNSSPADPGPHCEGRGRGSRGGKRRSGRSKHL